MPNILFITTHLNPGGITSYIFNLSKGLISNGHKIVLVSSGGSASFSFENIGVKVINLNIKTKSELSPKIWLNIGRVVRIIQQEKIDIIHAHTRITQVIAQMASNKTKVPFLSTCHGFFKPRFFRRKFGCWGDKVIAISDAVKDHLISDFAVSKEKVELVYNGIDLSLFSVPSLNEKVAAKKVFNLSNKPTIGIIARLSGVKGHKFLIAAFKKVLDQGFDAQLFIVGEGPIKLELIALIKRYNIEDKVHFHPSVSNTAEPLKAIDIFCMPSLMEGLGLAVAEAQAMGVPVIASRVGGLVSLVQDGETGLLVEPRDSTGISESIIRLLKDSCLAGNLVRQARENIKNKFSLDKMVANVQLIYKRLINENPKNN